MDNLDECVALGNCFILGAGGLLVLNMAVEYPVLIVIVLFARVVYRIWL
jgi:hypothetical protein